MFSDQLLSLPLGVEAVLPAVPAGITEADLCKVAMVPTWNLSLPEDVDVPVDVVLSVGNEWALKLTQHTLYSLASNFGISKSLLAETPPELTQPLMNYWLSVVGAEHAPRFVYNVHNVAIDLFRPYAAPPLQAQDLLIFTAEQMGFAGETDPSDVTVSSYLTANYREVIFRLIFPTPEGQVIPEWEAGVQVTTSPSGQSSTSLVMIFRRSTDGLLVTVPRHEFKYSPKRHGAGEAAFCDWLSDAIGLLYTEVPEERVRMKHMHFVDVEEDLQSILNDLYTTVSLPLSLRALVNDGVEHLPEGATGYDLMLVVAEAANAPGEPEGRRERARRAAGRLYAVLGSRCASCHSLLKDHD